MFCVYRQDCLHVVVTSLPFFPMQSVPITTKVGSSNPAHGEVYSMQHYVIKFVSDLRQISGFCLVLRFTLPIKLTVVIQLKVALNTINQPTNPSFLDYDITGFFKMSSGMGATSGAGTTYPCEELEFNSCFDRVHVEGLEDIRVPKSKDIQHNGRKKDRQHNGRK